MFHLDGIFAKQLRRILSDIDPSRFVLAYDTAADYLGMTNLSEVFNIELFVESPISELNGNDGYIQHIVDISKKDYSMVKGLNCTSPNQTVIDLLRRDGDQQVIQETLADYYFSHNESYDGLIIPPDIQESFNKYGEWAKEYYMEC